jgi:hypothetical protein
MQYYECYTEPIPQKQEIPIYVSLTSIFQNQDIMYETLLSIKNQTMKPDKICIYLSKEPYLLDTGFKDGIIIDTRLQKELENPIYKVVWVKNEGSYRKLIPILKEKWNEDCIIITVDDDVVYDENLIENLYYDYLETGCSVAYRGFISNTLPDKYKYGLDRQVATTGLYNFGTGKGGILYCPYFFHKTGNLIFNSELYLSDKYKTKDDVWFYLIRIKNNIKLMLGLIEWLKIDNSNKIDRPSLSTNYNTTENNTEAINSTLNI